MVDITSKTNTLRIAVAQAIVHVSSEQTILAIQNKLVPKGDVFEMAKAAGLLGVKKTPDLLPDCHPIPIEFTGIDYSITGLNIEITMTVKTIYKTGVEVEAMHGASIVALTMYDMLKPIDKGVEIRNIRLLEKKGGKSSFKSGDNGIKARVIVCSDSISQGKNEDKAGKTIVSRLEKYGLENIDYHIIPDEKEEIIQQAKNEDLDLLIFTGGTGVGPRDNTYEALKPCLEVELDGVVETMRHHGQQKTPYAMLSRSLAGIRKKTLILAVPGSTGGATDAMDSLFPHLFHIFEVLKGRRHE